MKLSRRVVHTPARQRRESKENPGNSEEVSRRIQDVFSSIFFIFFEGGPTLFRMYLKRSRPFIFPRVVINSVSTSFPSILNSFLLSLPFLLCLSLSLLLPKRIMDLTSLFSFSFQSITQSILSVTDFFSQ